jgi:hypothetical protein
MIPRIRVALFGLVFLGPGVLVDAGAPPYKSPEDVLAAAMKAVDKEDWRGFCLCLTEDSRVVMVGGMAQIGVFMKLSANFPGTKEEDKARFKAIDDVLKKHGLTEEHFSKLSKEPMPKDKAGMQAALRKIGAPVKDRAAFVADMMKTMKSLSKDGQSDFAAIKSAKLEELKVEGDTAKGVIVTQVNEKDKREPIEFRKVSGSWLIEIPGIN